MKNLSAAPIITDEQMQLHRLGLPVPVTEKVAAVLTGRSLKRLQYERARHTGLPVRKDGRSVRYFLADCLKVSEPRS